MSVKVVKHPARKAKDEKTFYDIIIIKVTNKQTHTHAYNLHYKEPYPDI